MNDRPAARPLPARHEGNAPINSYGAVGDGCSVALLALDGSVDWWCVRTLDAPPLFDRLIDPEAGGFFALTATDVVSVERRYRDRSNVLETTYRTATGVARLTESLNSGPAGRLPWAELARRIDGVEGTVEWTLQLRAGSRGGAVVPRTTLTAHGPVMQVADVMAILMLPESIEAAVDDRGEVLARFTVTKEQRLTVAVVATENEPLMLPRLDDIDARIDGSDAEWRDWADTLRIDFDHPEHVCRAALALKFLIFSPTGAIAAAATTSLPEQIGGAGNWDYRYAWVRDGAYTINAFLHVGALPEATAAFNWLFKTIRKHGVVRPCYTLSGERVPPERLINVDGYAGSLPVRIGNQATAQSQLSVYGDLFDMTWRMVKSGHLLDDKTRAQLFDLADECASVWKRKDSGFWEIDEVEQFTISKIECWSALGRACELAECGVLPADHVERWRRERARILEWINTEGWSQARQAYRYHAGSDDLDASILLAPRFGFGLEGPERARFISTRSAVEAELVVDDGLVYRFSGASTKEGAFVATSWWLVEAYGLLGEAATARRLFDRMCARLDPHTGLQSEMIDPATGAALGNLPQGLSHLALIHAALSLGGE